MNTFIGMGHRHACRVASVWVCPLVKTRRTNYFTSDVPDACLGFDDLAESEGAYGFMFFVDGRYCPLIIVSAKEGGKGFGLAWWVFVILDVLGIHLIDEIFMKGDAY